VDDIPNLFANYERSAARSGLAQHLWDTSYDRLLNFGISSYRDITDQDTIGIPVWIAYRPPGTSISVTCGKSLDPLLAFAGAITEALEVWAAEHPNGQNWIVPYRYIKESGTLPRAQVLPLKDYPLARDNVLDETTPISWELVDRIQHPLVASTAFDQMVAWMPSNMIWLEDRANAQFLDVQQSSNGLAAGINLEDALLAGIYELVERDGWTIHQFIRESIGTPPRKIPILDIPSLPEALAIPVRLMVKAGLYPLLFDCTTDIGIPVCGCALLGRDGVGTFGGYGAAWDPRIAALRALTEAAQSRLCYINGARDDLYRRDFLLMKSSSSGWLIEQLEALKSPWRDWDHYCELPVGRFESIHEELGTLVHWLAEREIKLYYRKLAEIEFEASSVVVVKVIAPALEGVWSESWQTNGRATQHLAKELQTDGRRKQGSEDPDLRRDDS